MDHEIVAHIRETVIGDGMAVETPYGVKRLTYADGTAAGRALSFVEDFVRQAVLPTFGNVHTASSLVGQQTSAYREEARDAIRRVVNAGPEYAVLFCGSGMTGSLYRLLTCMGLTVPCRGAKNEVGANRPVVFVSSFEHHSVELQFRESVCDVVVIKLCPRGRVDLDDIERQLKHYGDRAVKIGCFSAASNVTGTLTDVRKIARVLHAAGALAFFDYAAAAPYVPIDVDPAGDPTARQDAVFLSPHKFPGGPGASGVLIARAELFADRPAVPGGGTVAHAGREGHTWSTSLTDREEGGTPNIVGDVRAGLAFRLKETVIGDDPNVIVRHEVAVARRVLEAWRAEPDIWVLGDLTSDRLGIVSIVVLHRGRALHQGFVAALLGDLFGIQVRAGTSCASPYGDLLLNVSPERSAAIEARIVAGDAGVRPGWTRLSFAYYDSPETLEYIVEAVLMVARDGWRAIVDYNFDPRTGHWTHRGARPPLRTLSDAPPAPEYLPESVYEEQLEAAREVLHGAAERCREAPPAGTARPVDVAAFEASRWFWLPEELAREISTEDGS